jgi:hypothetical protein
MSEAIDQAFIDTILSGGLAIDVVHENGLYSTWSGTAYTHTAGVYTPDANREHCEIRNFPADRVPYSLNHSDVEVGFFQIILKYPSDIGAHTIKAKAEDVLALFKHGTPITYGSQSVNIDSKRRDGGRIEGGFYQIVVRISYRAFVSR